MSTRAPPNVDLWAEILETLDRNGRLTDEQHEIFYQQLLIIDFRIRPRVRRGELLPIKMQYESRAGADSKWTFTMDEAWLRIGQGWLVRCPGVGSGKLPLDQTHSMGYTDYRDTSFLPPGRYPVVLTTTKTIAKPGTDWVRVVSFNKDLEILPADAEDPITVTPNPSLEPALRAAVSCSQVYIGSPQSGKVRVEASLQIRGPLPANVSFDLILAANEQETFMPTIAMARDDPGVLASNITFLPASAVDGNITLVLRSSRKAASKTVNLFDIWGGELRLENVPVTRAP